MKQIEQSPQPSSSYDDYARLLEPINSRSPQAQGLFQDEYQDALMAEGTITTSIRNETGKLVDIPQLARVETYSWLNSDYYKGRFPEAAVLDGIRHYFDIPGVEPGEQVQEQLRELAAKRGILVFDYPDSDAGYEDRVTELLSVSNVEHGSPVLLGTQAYFAGKVRLKRGFDSEKPIMRMHEAFQAMIRDGLLPADLERNGASYAQYIDQAEAKRLYPNYEAAFARLNQHPCRQGLTPVEFFDVMTEEPETAKLRYNVNGETSTLLIFGDDLTKYEWINPEFYAQHYPTEYQGQQIMYFPALYTDTSKQGEANSEHVVNLIADMVEFGNNEIIVAFDCCDINIGFLDSYIEALVNATPEASLQFDRVGTQRYCAIQLGDSSDKL